MIGSALSLTEAGNLAMRGYASSPYSPNATAYAATREHPTVTLFRPRHPDGLTSQKRRDDLNEAIVYLSTSKAGRDLIQQMQDEPWPLKVTIDDVAHDGYQPGTDMIVWNPNFAIRDRTGATQSPTLGLAHEIGHAISWRQHPGLDFLIGCIPVPPFENGDEWAVISYVESPIARELGEDVRRDYVGRNYWVPGPTSRIGTPAFYASLK